MPKDNVLADVAALARRPAKELLREIRRKISWGENPDELIREFGDAYSDREADLNAAMARGRELREVNETFYQLGVGQGASSEKVKQRIAEIEKTPDRELIACAKKALDRGDRARRRREQHRKRRHNGGHARQSPLGQGSPWRPPVPLPGVSTGSPGGAGVSGTQLSTLHRNDVRGLAPQSGWVLLVDESGTTFDEGAERLPVRTNDREMGRIAGVLVQESKGHLKDLPRGWHAVDQTLDELDRVVRCICEARVGVLGLTVRQLPETPGQRWVAAILALIDWVVRLMPLDYDAPQPARLTVLVEARDPYVPGHEWQVAAEDLARRLARAHPARARRIRLQIRLIEKTDSALNGYADAVAYTWSSPAQHARERLEWSGWRGCCLLEMDAVELLQAWDAMERGASLTTEQWRELVGSTDARVSDSLTSTILQRLGELAREDSRVWERFLGAVQEYLNGKGLDVGQLGRQIDWLELWRPEDKVLYPALRLVWLTYKLALANHLGAAEQAWMQEMESLGTQLFDEDARLVCRADLNLAVNATNRFEFDVASRALDRWRGEPVALLGLRFWGHVQSSLGQHAAFLGNFDQAAQLFEKAIAAFERLSDPSQRRRELAQTATYLAIAVMDDPTRPEDDAKAATKRALGDNIEAAASSLAGSTLAHTKYAHHLLLRYLVYRKHDAARKAYLAQRDEWQVPDEQGHPWPLIELYRGYLLHPGDPKKAIEHGKVAYDIATDSRQGPTVELIGACCRAIVSRWENSPWPESEAELGRLAQLLPAATDRIQQLRTFMAGQDNEGPLGLLAKVLPFNFH